MRKELRSAVVYTKQQIQIQCMVCIYKTLDVVLL